MGKIDEVSFEGTTRPLPMIMNRVCLVTSHSFEQFNIDFFTSSGKCRANDSRSGENAF